MKDECKSYRKYKAVFKPRCGCRACWDKYFLSHLSEVATTEFAIRKFGPRGVESVCGEIYRKQLERFVKEQGSPLEAYELANPQPEEKPNDSELQGSETQQG